MHPVRIQRQIDEYEKVEQVEDPGLAAKLTRQWPSPVALSAIQDVNDKASATLQEQINELNMHLSALEQEKIAAKKAYDEWAAPQIRLEQANTDTRQAQTQLRQLMTKQRKCTLESAKAAQEKGRILKGEQKFFDPDEKMMKKMVGKNAVPLDSAQMKTEYRYSAKKGSMTKQYFDKTEQDWKDMVYGGGRS